MKLSEYKNEDALEILANIIEPATVILTDKEVKAGITKKGNKMGLVKYLLKTHKKPVIEIMASLNGSSPEEYEFNIVSGTMQLLDLMNDEELLNFFQSQGQTENVKRSGFATENITETEET